MDMITSTSNNKIKDIRQLLRDASYRREKGIFISEGIRMFREIPAERLLRVYVSQTGYERFHDDLKSRSIDETSPKLQIIDDRIYKSISQTKTPQGIMAEVACISKNIDDIIIENGLYLVLDGIQDPGNLGTIIRTAEATGVAGVIMGNGTCDIYNPKVVRSTMGAIFRVPFIYSDDLEATLAYLKTQGITIYGAHLSGRDFYEEDYRGATAFLIGNEGNGISPQVAYTADKLIRIPMMGQVESLNAAISVAVLSYEVLRQKKC